MAFNKLVFHQCIVFILTFWAYVSLHTARQAYSNAKKNMIDDWGFTKHEEGIMDAVFLFAYACGLYLSGYIGDYFDATRVLFCGLFLTGIIVIIFGSSYPYFNITHDYYFILIWTLNGFVQSTGWPTSVKIMGKWFGENHAGFIFGIWSANASVGNIVGASMVTFVHNQNWGDEWMFYLPGLQLIILSIFIILFVRTQPSQWSIITDDNNDYNNNNYNNNDYHKQAEENDGDYNPKHYSYDKNENQHKISTSSIDEDNFIYTQYDDGKGGGGRDGGITFLHALCLPNVITYALCYACLKSVNYTMFFWLPYFLNNVFDQTVSDDLSIIYNVGQIFGGWVCGWISDYLHRRSPPVFIFLLIAIPPIFLLRIPSHSIYFFGILSGLAGFFVGGPANMISSAISADLGKHKSLMGNTAALATVAGIIDGTGSFGAAMCQYAVSLLSDISWDLVFVVLTVLLLSSAGLILNLTIKETKILFKYGRKESAEIQNEYGIQAINDVNNNSCCC